ncbi:hypothetical protein ZWY2020_051997 [Hordeum vulgare]|nr:hypothetical protein ZWY2020_051997 [Hordeum vulgare]
MVDKRSKFTQPDEDTPFGRHLKEATKYLNIELPSFTGTFIATLPEEERWKIRVQVPGRTFIPVTKPIEFSFNAPTWGIGKSIAAQITMGHIGEVYHADLEDTIYQICGRRDDQGEIVITGRDISVASYIQELNQHIQLQENQMYESMDTLQKAMTRIKELEEELKSTRDGYEEEMTTLVEKNDDLIKKLEVFMTEPTIGGDEDVPPSPKSFIIIDDTDCDPDEKDDDYVDEAGADIMESSADQNF